MIGFVRSEEAEAFTGAVIEMMSDLSAETWGKMSETSALGEVLTDESVGVLVGAAFPGVMGSGEEEGSIECVFDRLVAVELGSVIRGNGADGVRLTGEQVDKAGVGVLDGGAGERADADQATPAFDGSSDAGPALAVDGVRFPVAVASPACDDVRTILDHPFSCESAAAVIAAIALAPALVRAAQVGPQVAAAFFVLPDPEVDRLVAHDGPPEAAQSPDDLLWAPAASQQSYDELEVPRSEAGVAPGPTSAATRHLHRKGRSIGSIVRSGVATQFSINRAAMSPQNRRDLRVRTAGLPQRRYLIPFLRAQLSIDHRPGNGALTS